MVGKRGGGKMAGRQRAKAETPWYLKRAQAQDIWKQQLKRKGVQFAIGGGPCRERSKSQCIGGEWNRSTNCRVPSHLSGEAYDNWASWQVPEALRERGITVGDPSLYGPLLRRLNRGEPVTLLALGSSVVGAHAGCTAAWPALKHCPCPRCCGSRCGRWGGGGWALRVLASINATWPHPGHRLYNLGEPGGDLMPSLLACPHSYLSFDPDVVFLDFFTAYHGGRDAAIYERVVRMLLTRRRSAAAAATAPTGSGGRSHSDADAPPVVMFVNFFEFADRHHAYSTYTSMGSQLTTALREMRRGRQSAGRTEPLATSSGGGAPTVSTAVGEPEDVAALWHTSSPSEVTEAAALIRVWARSGGRHLESTDVFRNWWRDQEVHALSMSYRLPAVWMFRAFGPEFERQAYGLSVRDFACYDGLHPNHDGRAEAMVSDLIWEALKRGFGAARGLARQGERGLRPQRTAGRRRNGRLGGGGGGAGGGAGGRRAGGVSDSGGTAAYVLPPPLQAMPARVGHVCFTFDAEGWEMLTGAKRTNRKLHEQSLIQTLQAPTILTNRGWSFIVYEPNSRTPFKPGIVASAPGSQLHFEVDTSRALSPRVSFQYLESRNGMGIARLDCNGCECEPAELDATGQVARLSTLVTREIAVTAHAHCELRLLLLNQTKSPDGGHKFKLARLFVTGAVGQPGRLVPASSSSMISSSSPSPSSMPVAMAAASSHASADAAEGALPIRGMRARFCRGPRCGASSGEASAGSMKTSLLDVDDELVDEKMHATRNAALDLLRAARQERPEGVRGAGLQLLLPSSSHTQ